MNSRSAEILLELKEILVANQLVDYVSTQAVEPLASETNPVAVYIQHTNVVPKVSRNSTSIEGYDYHGYYMLVVNVDCSEDEYKVYDVADSIQRSILSDSQIWGKLVDRDVLTIEYDNSEFYPKRSIAIALEVLFRLSA